MEKEKTYCHNCGTASEQEYCPACGQRTSVHKVTFRETFQDLADQLFTLSAPLPQTLKILVVNPGVLFRDYLSGKRKRYYKPISFFLLTTLLFILIRWLVDFNPVRQTVGTPTDNPLIESDLVGPAADFMFQNINNLLFIMVFTLAILMKVFFFKNYTLAEYIAVSFYLVGFYTLIATLNIFYLKYLNPDFPYLHMLLMSVYFIYAMFTFMTRRKWLVVIKAFLTYYLAYALYLILAFYFSYFVVFLESL